MAAMFLAAMESTVVATAMSIGTKIMPMPTPASIMSRAATPTVRLSFQPDSSTKARTRAPMPVSTTRR